jgi:hypothetical protein
MPTLLKITHSKGKNEQKIRNFEKKCVIIGRFSIVFPGTGIDCASGAARLRFLLPAGFHKPP